MCLKNSPLCSKSSVHGIYIGTDRTNQYFQQQRQQKGIVIHQSFNPDTALFEAQYQRRFLLQGHTGVDVSYALGKNWYVSAGPRAHFDLTQRTAKNAATVERFLWYGVQVGVWRTFTKL